MRRSLGAITFVVLALVTLHPLLTYGSDAEVSGGEASEGGGTTITRYDTVVDVREGGDAEVTETFQVEVAAEGDRSGLVRVFDEYDPHEPKVRRVPRAVRVAVDGERASYELLTTGTGRFRTLQVDSGGRMLAPGEHTYVIRYELEDLLHSESAGSRLHWDVVPGSLGQSVEEAQATVLLPEAGRDVQCTAGSEGSCVVSGDATSTLVLTATDLAAGTPVTVRAELPTTAASVESELPWSTRWAQVLGDSWVVLLATLLGIVLAGWYGHRVAYRTHERPPEFPLVHAPAAGVGPMQAVHVLQGQVPRRALVASLLYAEQRGAVTVHDDGDDWRVEGTASDVDLDEVTGHALAELGVSPGRGFAVRHSRDGTGTALEVALESSTQRTQEWAREQGLLAKDGPGALGAIAVVAALVFFAVLVWARIPSTAIALVPGAFAAFGVTMLRPGAGVRRTAAGRRLWAQVGGHRRALSAPSDRDPFGFADDPGAYEEHLPWAVAFGCVDEWADKFRVETGREPPVTSVHGFSDTVASVVGADPRGR